MRYHKIYLQEFLSNLDAFGWLQAQQLEVPLTPGWHSWAGAGMDVAAATDRNELVKRCRFSSHWGLAGAQSSPLRETPGAGGRIGVCILLLRDSTAFLRAYDTTLTSNLRKNPQSTHCPCQPTCFPHSVLDHPHHTQLAQCRKYWAKMPHNWVSSSSVR